MFKGKIIERKYVHGHNSPKTAVKVPCDNCGKIIEQHPYQLKRREKYFCNRACHAAYKKGFRTVVECGYCGNNFAIIQARAKIKTKTGKIYCSSKCRNDSENTITKCSYCHNPMKVINHRAKIRSHVFCNSGCQKKWEIEVNIGENHPMWTGTRKRNMGTNWREMRRQVLKRDNKTCRLCGSRRRVSVHHIIPARFFDEPEDGNILDNLIALCTSCHTHIEPRMKDNPTNEMLKKLIKKNPHQMTLGI